MKNEQPSATALAGAAVRALESLRLPSMRWCNDPYAAHFLRPHHRLLLRCCARSPRVHDFVERVLDRRYPGVPMDFITRTRWIDAHVQRWLGDAPERLLIVGAGYDTRGLRMDFPHGAVCVEIDHPSTQRRKRAIAERVAGARASRVVWMARDLALGFPMLADVSRTFAIVEGLTSYISMDATRSLVRGIAEASAPGSEIVFTYIDRAWLDAISRGEHPDGASIVRAVQQSGEPFQSGFTPAEAEALLVQLGYTVCEDVDEATLADSFTQHTGRRLTSIAGFRLLHARRGPAVAGRSHD